MFTDPKSQQFKALLRDFILASSEYTAAAIAILSGILTTRGDLLYRSATTAARLAVGANGQFLKSDGTDPVWQTANVTDGFSIPIEYPADKTYLIWEDFPYAATVTATHSRCSTGTADVVMKINGTALGGGENEASTSEDEVTHSTNNAIAAGDDLTLTVSGTSSCEDLVYSVRITRTL